MSDYDEDDYDDDFEDYEDEDFEDYEEEDDDDDDDDDDAAAQEEEEKQGSTAGGVRPVDRIKVGLGEEEKYLRKLRRERWDVLRDKVKLQEVAIDNLFVMPPYSLRQLQQMGCGAFKNRIEKGTSLEKREAKKIQTDRIQSRGKAAQHPETETTRTKGSMAASVTKVMKSRLLSSSSKRERVLQASQQKRFANFVISSGRIIEKLLSERRHRSFHSQVVTSLSPGSPQKLYEIGLESHFGKRPVESMVFSRDRPPLLAVALGPEESENAPPPPTNWGVLSRSSLISVWHLESIERPAATCVSSGEVSCCCFGPSKQSVASSSAILIGGMREGGLCLWDCGEPETKHEQVVGRSFADKLKGRKATVRWPSYTTEGSAGKGVLHMAEEVLEVRSVPDAKGEGEGKENVQFRAVSLSRLGIGVWDVCGIPFADNLSQVSGTDLGLRIGSRYKMVKNTVIDFGLDFDMKGVPACFSAARDELTTLAVGTSEGMVYRFNRFGTVPRPPRYFFSDKDKQGSPVLGLDFSPHEKDLLLCCHMDGSISLYRVTRSSEPIRRWKVGSEVVQVRWSSRDPEVFFALEFRSSRLLRFVCNNSRRQPDVIALEQKNTSCFRGFEVCDDNEQQSFLSVADDHGDVSVFLMS